MIDRKKYEERKIQKTKQNTSSSMVEAPVWIWPSSDQKMNKTMLVQLYMQNKYLWSLS